ncbi:hypothetical protein V7138_14895 [Bacillus sp. JJ1533]
MKTKKIKVNVGNAEKLLRGNLNGKIFLSKEGKNLLKKAVVEKRV